MADKNQKEKEDVFLDQKKEWKAESNCWMKKDLSSGLEVKKKQAAGQEKHGVEKEFQCEAKESKGTHRRDLSGVESKQGHGDELRKPSRALQEKSNVESHHVQKTSEPLREKEPKPLPGITHGQNPTIKPQTGDRLNKEHSKSREPREAKAGGDPSTQPDHSEPRDVPAPQGPSTQCAPAAAARPLGEGPEAGSSHGDRGQGTAVSPKPPLLFDLTLDSQNENRLSFPGQSVQRNTSATSGVSKKVEPSDPAAQRVYLTTQLKQKKVTADLPCALFLFLSKKIFLSLLF